jgi:threonine dehydratase
VGQVPGVVTGSAGNHAQSLAYAAREAGIPCEVFMPAGAAVSKVAAVEAFGATVHMGGATLDECVAEARSHAAERGITFVHPFDDFDVIAGQAGVGIELVDQVEDLQAIVLPVGGGGLASGAASAAKRRRGDISVVGVQAKACAPFVTSASADDQATGSPRTTLADGIAVKTPGEITRPLVERWVDELVTVTEAEIAAAMVMLINRSKLVVEGAGAVGLAAVLSGAVKPSARGTTAVVVSGGNVDPATLAAVAAREETRAGRRIRFLTYVPDRPGGLAGLLDLVAASDANVLEVSHVRDGIDLAVGQTGVELSVSIRGEAHGRRVVEGLEDAGYAIVQL